MLQTPPAGEWPSWRRGYDGQGFSPLNRSTRTTSATLRAAWSWALPNGPNESTPLFHDGVLFVHAYGDKVQAIDAATGDLAVGSTRAACRWARPSASSVRLRSTATRSTCGTSDTHVVALDAKTGRVVWDTPIADAKQGYGLTGGVTVAKGRSSPAPRVVRRAAITSSRSMRRRAREAWRFGTIPKDGEFGGNTWNNVPYEKRNGGSVWVPGSYDSTTGLLYIGVGQTYDTGPYRDPVAGANDDLLFTDSTLAIDPDTGKLEWHFQHLSNDQWDYDWAFTRTLVRLTPGGKLLVGTGGKQAVYDYLDAKTGRVRLLVRSRRAERHHQRRSEDRRQADRRAPDARQRSNRDDVPARRRLEELAARFLQPGQPCPVRVAGRSVHGSAAGRARRTRQPVDGRALGAAAAAGQRRQVRARPRHRHRDEEDLWMARQRAPMSTGVLATAGGVVFAGAIDRGFSAYDDATGHELWHTRLNDVPSSAPITYIVNGRQYVALVTGNGGAQAATFPALVPEIRNPPDRGATLWVFELPAR